MEKTQQKYKRALEVSLKMRADYCVTFFNRMFINTNMTMTVLLVNRFLRHIAPNRKQERYQRIFATN